MIKTLAKSLREYKKQTILTPLFMTLEVIFEVIIPFLMAEMIDHMTGESMQPILRYGAVLFVIAMLSLTSGVLAARFSSTAACGFAKNMRQDIFFRVQDFAFQDIDKFSASSLVTRMTTDVANVQNAFGMVIRMGFRAPLMMIFSVIMAATINWKMSLIFLVLIPILGAAIFGIMFKVMPIFKRIFKKYDKMNNVVQENIAGMRVVKSFVREDFEIKKFDDHAETVRDDFTHVERILALNGPIMMTGIFSAITLVSFFGAKLIIASGATSLTTGELSSLINYGVQILASIMMLSMIVVMISISMESASRISEVLSYEATLTSPENGETKVENGEIIFDNVSFKYSERSKKYALSDINLTIPSGSTVGIIGGTGSSKTSLIQLISRLYDTTEGRVMVGGKDVRDYDLVSLRDSVAVVLQKNVLFAGTIKENIRWGKKDATDEEIQHVCELAQADEFIQQFPDKYDTMITHGGTNVSGGQKQRLCIARALMKKPEILILDDSTSAVDTKTDALIRKAFREEIPDTTKIIIAQRVSSVEDADMILVMDGGRIVERGTSEELIALGGIYKEVYDSQTKGKEA